MDTDLPGEIRREHKRLHELLKRLEGVDRAGRALPILEELWSLLVAHFRREEGPEGLEEIIGRRAPRHLEALYRLIAQHEVFLETVSRLVDRIRAGEEKTDEVQQLSRALCRHEAEETELLQDAIYLDVGGAGD